MPYKHVGLDDILVDDVDQVGLDGAGPAVRARAAPGHHVGEPLGHGEEMVVIDWNEQDGRQ